MYKTIHTTTRTDSVKYGESFTPYYVTTPTGYYQDSVYNYWDSSHTTELGNGTTGVTPFTVTDNRIVHVHYRPNTYTISYNLNGGSYGASAPTSGIYATTVTVSNPTRVGHTFNGWSVSGTGAVLSGTNLTIGSSNITLIANWTANTYTVVTNYYRYYQNTTWQQFSTKTDYIKYGQTYTPSYTTTPTGYYRVSTYSIWNSSNSTQIGSGTVGSTPITITDNIVVHVDYKPNTYTITYNLGGGTKGSSAPSSGVYATTVTVSNPTRAGYTFTGWSVSGTGAVLSGTNLTIGSSNITLTAKWQALSLILSYKCANTSKGSSPYNFEYSGNCSIVDDGSNNWRVKFLSSGTFKPNVSLSIDVFLVGGGANGNSSSKNSCSNGARVCYNGGSGGKGGACSTNKKVSITGGTSYTITVGGTNSASSAFGYSAAGGAGASGGSGISGESGEGGAGSSGCQEFGSGSTYYGGGGGGAGGVHSTYGGTWSGGSGGAGGGGAGGTTSYYSGHGSSGSNGTANTGGGGGGAGRDRNKGYSAGSGGSGIVIIRNAR